MQCNEEMLKNMYIYDVKLDVHVTGPEAWYRNNKVRICKIQVKVQQH